MGNPNKRRGTAWESAVVRFLRETLAGRTDDIRRQVQMGHADIGDVHADPFALECKNTRQYDLAAFVEQAEREAENAGLPYGAAVVKRRGKGPGHGYVVMSLATFARVLSELRRNTRTVRER